MIYEFYSDFLMILQGHDFLDREFPQMLHSAGICTYMYPKNDLFM